MTTKMTETTDRRVLLESAGFVVGTRDPRLNRNYVGRYMVVEAHEERELPTDDGSNGPWCIVGDDLDALIAEAFTVWADDIVEGRKEVPHAD